jgi:formylglycine-generating enzyme required for sulfatase activity
VKPFALDKTEVSARDFSRFVDDTGYRTTVEGNGPIIAHDSGEPVSFGSLGYQWDQPIGFGTTFQQTADFPVLNVSAVDAEAYCAWAHPGGRLPTEAEWEYIARRKDGSLFPGNVEDANMRKTLLQPFGANQSGALTAITDTPARDVEGYFGMAGNAREWVKAETGYVLKGGSFRSTNAVELRNAARVSVDARTAGIDFGFRCARSMNEWEN